MLEDGLVKVGISEDFSMVRPLKLNNRHLASMVVPRPTMIH